MDAKYRIDRTGRASEDSRKDVTAYLGLYGLRNVAIVYPGTGQDIGEISGRGRRIVEVALRPPSNLAHAVEAVQSLLESPPFS